MKTRLILAALVCASVADAATVRQIFRPERFSRGDTNIRPVQPIDAAAWVWSPDAPVWGVAAGSPWGTRNKREEAVVRRFRVKFRADATPLRLDVSADERFVLFLDGKPVARGPHRGLVSHWIYQSYEITDLAAGEHRLEAVCWQLGSHAPLAQLSWRGGFVLKAEGSYDAQLTTGRAKWEVGAVSGLTMTDLGTSGTFGTGTQCEVTGTSFLDAEPETWQAAKVVRRPIPTGTSYGGRVEGWLLFPTERPDETYVSKTPGKVVNADQPLNGEIAVPAHAERDFWWDLDDYYCAYPELETSGGKGAVVTWGWAESLWTKDGRKDNRDEWKGKTFARTLTDTFRCDGRPAARFTTPWWRCGRWCRVTVKTADEPLVIRRIALGETAYPLALDGTFECDDATFAPILRICRRSMASCMHEMLFDCPYYEQQMYPGDTRIQLLVLDSLTRDDRMLRFAMSAYDWDRRDNGMVPMNFPTRGTQESATYTMCWTMMFGDYLMWHDNAAFLKARMPGVRHALMGLAQHENAEGLLENLPGWSFMDWVDGAFKGGVSPCGSPGEGVSALNALLYLQGLRSAAAVDAALGEPNLAAHWNAKAARLKEAIVRNFWDESRGLVADTKAKDRFSEHAQCLAILGDVLAPAQRQRAFAGLVGAKDLARASTYFAHYLFETYAAGGRADLIRARFDDWRNFLKWGGRTAFETQHATSRSDCHAWSACPLYFVQSVFAGVRPAAPFFRRVRVAPQPAGLKFIRATTPCPQGVVTTDLRFAGEGVSGTVTLPQNLTGTFEWQGKSLPLAAGANRIDIHSQQN